MGASGTPARDGAAHGADPARLPQAGRLRASYRRRVTVDELHERVSLRHLVDEPGRGPVATDVVGRLLAIDDEMLLVVDRSGTLHVIETASVLASRVVPPHPRLPAEPVVGTRAEPLVRHAARAVILDDRARILLLAHHPGDGGRIWTAPGGGLRPDEAHADAAGREVREELGVEIEVGPWIWSRRVLFCFRGVWLDQAERWFLSRHPAFDISEAPLTDPAVDAARWWTCDELATSRDLFAPRDLATHLRSLLEGGAPDTPLEIGD